MDVGQGWVCSCGTSNKIGARFCRKCGGQVSTPPISAVTPVSPALNVPDPVQSLGTLAFEPVSSTFTDEWETPPPAPANQVLNPTRESASIGLSGQIPIAPRQEFESADSVTRKQTNTFKRAIHITGALAATAIIGGGAWFCLNGGIPWASPSLDLPTVQREAHAGNSKAQDQLGQALCEGEGTQINLQEAALWFRKGAEQGYAPAQAHLGRLYQIGLGVPSDDIEGLRWIRLAVEQENSDAQRYLGYAHQQGKGVPKDETEAVKWFRKSAEQGNATSQHALGACYNLGRGISKNDLEAVKWYRKSAEQGNSEGQLRLGAMYLNGWGIPKNETEAVKWFKKSAKQGNDVAKSNLVSLKKN